MGVVALANQCRYYSVFFLLCLFISLGGNWLFWSRELKAQTLSQWSFNPNTYQLRFTAESEPEPFLLQNPTRIVIDLPKTTWQKKSVGKNYGGLVTAIRIAQFQPDITRIVLELSPEAKLLSQNIKPEIVSTPEGKQWQFTPRLKKVDFPLSRLLQIPPVMPRQPNSPVTVEVPSLPVTKEMSSQLRHPGLNFSSGKTFNLRYCDKKPLTLEVGQPSPEILFLENALKTHKKYVTYNSKRFVIDNFDIPLPRTRSVTEALIPFLEPFNSNPVCSAIPIKARSHAVLTPILFHFSKVTIPSNTVFTPTLTEDLPHNL
ncbi:MAG: AMIN domain-containing protein [Halothece sp. Uz-M2-17]|nr:AMIN domain-containing protein [Halothece sp. Uz-M2-17]